MKKMGLPLPRGKRSSDVTMEGMWFATKSHVDDATITIRLDSHVCRMMAGASTSVVGGSALFAASEGSPAGW